MKASYYKSHKAEILAKNKEYREKNRERIALQKKQAHEKNRERDLLRSRRHYHENKEIYLIRERKRYEANPERNAEYGRSWAAANPEKRLEISRKYNRKIRSTPKGNLSSTVSKRMNESLRKGMKAGRHWETLVDFTVDQLKAHLEKLFKPGWSWENYGTVWHIDHRTPIAAFNFERPDDIDFRLCWSLKNLQPMEASKNRSKGDKIEEPFQPSLALAIAGG
ncbi:MAG TPA: hypothetical protein VLH56_02510 [Dissulfurispiraceae bacterium]|nr:hypothetical protein [Dissulfurispiraceae bacterium]